MAIFRERFSSEDLLHLLVFCAFPIHVWTIVNMFKDVPSWALYMRYWELISTAAYTLVFALFETIIIFTPFFLISLIIPRRWLSDVFVPWAGVMLVEGAVAAIAFQDIILTSGPKKKAVAVTLVAMALSTVFILRSRNLRKIVRIVAQRFAPLIFIYIFFDLIALVIVIVRNV